MRALEKTDTELYSVKTSQDIISVFHKIASSNQHKWCPNEKNGQLGLMLLLWNAAQISQICYIIQYIVD